MKRRNVSIAWMAVVITASTLPAGSVFAQTGSPHDCSFCHTTHSAPGPTLLLNADVEVHCLSCHGPAGTSTKKAAVHSNATTQYAAFSMSCIDCHTPHSSLINWLGGTNIMQVGKDVSGGGVAEVSTPNSGIRDVVFESRGTGAAQPSLHSFADSDEDANTVYDGVCEVCHTLTGHHRNNLADATHYTGDTCVTCHTHDSGFAPSGECTDCHNSIQDDGDGTPLGGRREIVSEFSLFSHHVQGTLVSSDCEACHEMTQHQQDQVRLKNADDPTNPGAVAVLTGDPLTSSTEAAKIEPICLACHDANGAGGSAPFSDSQMPPVIDSTKWATASHSLGLAGVMTCFGGDGQFGCHNTGHGSQKRKLLAPWDLAPIAPDYVSEEEGACYVCHDATGPAGTNLEADFAKAISHPVANSLQVVGRPVECEDCHNPHGAQGGAHTYNTTATAARNQVSPPLVGASGVSVSYAGLGNFVAPALGNYTAVDAATYEYEVCFKCHSGYAWLPGAPPAGLSPNGTAVNPDQTDLAQEFSSNNMSGHPVVTGLDNYPNSIVVGGKKGLLASAMTAPWNTNMGQQTMMCSDCHNTDASSPAAQGPHGSAAQFMLRGPNSANWPDVSVANFSSSWCANCHTNSAGAPHTEGGHTENNLPCYACHIVIPHGGKVSRLIADHDGMPARYAYNNQLRSIATDGATGNGMFPYVEAFTKAATGSYDTPNCKAGCYADHDSTTPSENW